MSEDTNIALVQQLHACFQEDPTYLSLRKACLLMMRVGWANENRGDAEPLLQGLVYRGQPASGEHGTLRVEHAFKKNPADHRGVPFILVDFPNGASYQKVVANNLSSVDLEDSSKGFLYSASLPFSISHIHPSADTALAMAEYSALYLFAIRENIMCNMDLKMFDITAIGPVRPVEDGEADSFKVDITGIIAFNPVVKVATAGLRLKKWINEVMVTNQEN